MLESVLTRKVIRLLNSTPGLWYYKCSDRFSSGIPDIIGCYKGRFFALELKAKDKKARPLQEYIIKKINRAGGSAICTDSLESVMIFIDAVGKTQTDQ